MSGMTGLPGHVRLMEGLGIGAPVLLVQGGKQLFVKLQDNSTDLRESIGFAVVVNIQVWLNGGEKVLVPVANYRLGLHILYMAFPIEVLARASSLPANSQCVDDVVTFVQMTIRKTGPVCQPGRMRYWEHLPLSNFDSARDSFDERRVLVELVYPFVQRSSRDEEIEYVVRARLCTQLCSIPLQLFKQVLRPAESVRNDLHCAPSVDHPMPNAQVNRQKCEAFLSALNRQLGSSRDAI